MVANGGRGKDRIKQRGGKGSDIMIATGGSRRAAVRRKKEQG